MLNNVIRLGATRLELDVRDGWLMSLGGVDVAGTPLRNPVNRFLPWFDSYEGEVFRRFALKGIEQRGDETVLMTRAFSDPDTMFRERRDCSGDLIFRGVSWDAAPVETDLRIVLKPASTEIDGRLFTGFTYWFEYDGGSLPIHRLLDRQTWEVGGNLDDVTVCVRNWTHAPAIRITADNNFSTGALGVDTSAVAFPGNLWGRWSLLPAFDFQYGRAGVLVGWFDQVSLIRSLLESHPGENWLRCMDMHGFEQANQIRTNPKSILFSSEPADDIDALNLWTRIHDQEQKKACTQLGIKADPPPQICFDDNVWANFCFDSTYEPVVDVAAEFGGEYVFIDSVFENGETYQRTLNKLVPPETQKGTVLEKCTHGHMCLTIDFDVSQPAGGEEGLKRMCERAEAKGVRIMSWVAAHVWPRTNLLKDKKLGHGSCGVIAAKESGYHPDTGYPGDCWPLNLNAPVAERLQESVLGICDRTGLAGFLWDSFSNLGWWHVDYSSGTMRPQWDRVAAIYAKWVNAGILIRPEAMVAFSNHSCVGMVGGNHYPAGLLAGYGYNTAISLPSDEEEALIKGEKPIDLLFQWVAHKHVPPFHFHRVPRTSWDPKSVAELKELIRLYRKYRHIMCARTVLKNDAGVLWKNDSGETLFFSFKEQLPFGDLMDAGTDLLVSAGLQANHIYKSI